MGYEYSELFYSVERMVYFPIADFHVFRFSIWTRLANLSNGCL